MGMKLYTITVKRKHKYVLNILVVAFLLFSIYI